MRLAIVFFLVGILWIPVSATVLHVPSQYSTIQGGIDASVDGDTVLVAPGTYYEHIIFQGKNISLFSSSGPEVTTISKAVDGMPLIAFQNGEDSLAAIKGFSITGSSNRGIYCISSSPIIDNNIITNNTSPFADGAGVYCSNSSATIRNNQFISNSSFRNGSSNKGGAVALISCSQVKVYENKFIANATSNGGGAIWCWSSSNCLIDRNLLVDNSTIGGGAIYLEGGISITVANNDFAFSGSNSYGGGIYLHSTQNASILNNIFYFNDDYAIYTFYGFTGTVDYNCYYQNQLGPTYGLLPGMYVVK